MSSTKVEFLYLSEKDMIAAGVLDGKKCVDVMSEVMSLLSEGNYLMGGPSANSHGIALRFPKESKFADMPKDGMDRRYMAMPAYLGGRFHKVGMKWYGSNKENVAKGLPRSILMVTLNDAETGAPIAFMSANLLSAMRTASVPFVAARYFAKKDSSVLSIVGAGQIGTASVIVAMAEYPSIKTIKIKAGSVASASAKKLKAYIEKNYPSVEKIEICATLQEAVTDADLICEAVSVKSMDDSPRLDASWLKKGAVILSSMNMIFDDDFVCNQAYTVIDNWKMYDEFYEGAMRRQKEEGVKRPFGVVGTNLISLEKKGKIKREDVPLIGDVVRGLAPEKTPDKSFVLIGACGMPIEDVGWGYTCYESALEKGIGVKLDVWDVPYLS